jgi:hypothetical protein
MAKRPNGLSVSIYRWSHDSLRKLTRRMRKEGVLTMRRSHDEFVYKVKEQAI